MLGFSLAVLAGLMAAMASVLSKLALEEGGKTVQTFMCGVITNESCSMVDKQATPISAYYRVYGSGCG